MKIIDINNWKGKKHYLWFKEYPTPHYSVTSRLDITHFYNFIKANNYPFFITFMYIVNKALNEVEEFRLRILNDQVVLYDVINPAYTIMTESLVFDNCEHEYDSNYQEYRRRAEEKIAIAKQGIKEEASYNDLSRLDQYYFTCLPWIDFTSMTHPMPNDVTITVPRIAWGKYIKENERIMIALNINVNHALVDGYPLAVGFNTIQAFLNEVEKHLE